MKENGQDKVSELKGQVRTVKPQDLQRAINLEEEGYPPDEAASYDKIIFRQKHASELFVGYFEGYDLYGFITGTRFQGAHLTEESMNTHVVDGDSVCIHSVCVDRKRRREGIATKLLKAYVQHVSETQIGVKRILLICHSELIPLYTRAGFTYLDKSQVVHGSRPWFEMIKEIS